MDLSLLTTGISLAKGLKDIAAMLPKDSAAQERLSLAAERVAFWQEQIEQIAKRNEELEKELAQAKTELSDANAKLEANAAQAEFVEHRGALFKRKLGGGYVEAVYCPKCHTSLGVFHDTFPFHCSACKWSSSFKERDLLSVLKELP